MSRAEADDFALESYRRAREAIASGAFKREIVPVEVPQQKVPRPGVEDEEPNRADISKMRSLKPAFQERGVLTVETRLPVMTARRRWCSWRKRKRGSWASPMARITGYAGAALAPEWFTIAPIDAIKRVLKQTGLSISDIDLFEINEAFSAVAVGINRNWDWTRKKSMSAAEP